MARDGYKHGNNRDSAGEHRDPMSMGQLTEALAAIIDQPRSSHENERAAATLWRIRLILTERMTEAIRHTFRNRQLRKHRRQRANSVTSNIQTVEFLIMYNLHLLP